MRKISATNIKMNFGDFIKKAQQEEIIITKNGKALLKVVPIRKATPEVIDELFDWGISGLKDEDVLEGMLEKYYGD